MAIASVGTLGTGISSVSNATFTFATVTNALAAGDIGLLFVAADNIATADGFTLNHSMPSGGAGRWSRLGEYTNAPSAATAVGATISLWMLEATATVAIGTTITVNFSASCVDKACFFWKFTVAAGKSLATNRQTLPHPISSEVNAAANFGSSAFSGLTSLSRLYVRALAKEANINTGNLTPSTNFTAMTRINSRNNAAAVTCLGEFRINTSTGETSNPVHATTGDSAGLFFALEEITRVAPSAQTDNFDDNALDTGAKWINISGNGGSVSETNQRLEETATTAVNSTAAVATFVVHDLALSAVYAKAVTFQAVGTDFIMMALRLYGDNGGYQWSIAGDGTTQSIYASRIENNYAGNMITAGTDVFTTSYNSSTHAWFRVRYESSDDKIYWDTAPASASNPPLSGDWVNQFSEARRQTLNFRITLETIRVGGTTASATCVWDGYNVSTTTITARTLTTSLNSAIQQARTATASVNAAIRTSSTISANTNAAILQRLTQTTTLSSAIKVAQTANANLNSAIQQARTASANINSAIQQTGQTRTASINAAVKAALAATASVNATIKESRTATANLNAAVQQLGLTQTTSVNGIVVNARTLQAAINAAIRLSLTLTTSLSATVKFPAVTTASLNALVRYARTVSTSLSAEITAAHITLTTSLNATIQERRTLTALMNAAIRQSLTASLSQSAAIRAGRTATTSLNGAIRQARTIQALVNAAIARQFTVTTSLAGTVKVQRTVTTALDYTLRYARTATTSFNAQINALNVVTLEINAAIFERKTIVAALNAAIRQAGIVQTSLNAAVQQRLIRSISTNAAIRVARTVTLNTSAIVRYARNITTGVDAALRLSRTAGASLNSAVRFPATLTSVLGGSIFTLRAVDAQCDGVIQVSYSVSVGIEATVRAALSCSSFLDAVVITDFHPGRYHMSMTTASRDNVMTGVPTERMLHDRSI